MVRKKTSSVISWAYISGFFDGEGCITAPNACVLIGMTQKHPEVLRSIGEFLGREPSKIKHGWILKVQGRTEVLDFIEGVLPSSIVKRQQLEVGKKIALLQPERYAAGSTKRSSTRRQREELGRELKRLKHG